MTAPAVVRPLVDADVPAAQEMSYLALRDAGQRYGWHMPELDDAGRVRGQRRIRHCLTHDPDGAVVAERDGEIVGIGLATRRGPLWFLSLLAVRGDVQGQGIGARLLDAALATFESAGAICASDDPKALRRYWRAGFTLLPTYEATGSLDRSRLPSPDGVRTGLYDLDLPLIDSVAQAQRSAPHGPDLDFYAASGFPLLIADTPQGRGYCVVRDSGPVVLGATTPAAATQLLWAALAATTEPTVEVMWLSHDQQWALDVVLAAGLVLRPSGTRCLRGDTGPMYPYIPHGGLG